MAAQAWAALTPLLAQRPLVRECRNGRDYPHRLQRRLKPELPAVAAAIHVYAPDGTTNLLVVDLDTGSAGREAVQRDLAAVQRYLQDAGAAYVCDESPTGGVHVYVPLVEPVGFFQARSWALALATRAPTMDVLPNRGLTDGLIRPPGARHRRGGHQVLIGSVAAAHHTLKVRNPPQVWAKLTELLAQEIDAVNNPTPVPSPTGTPGAGIPVGSDAVALDAAGVDLPHVPRKGGSAALSADYLRIARDGIYDTGRYASPSEARQAVITAAVWRGMTLTQVRARMHNGTWPGLAALYAAKYEPKARAKAHVYDWTAAVTAVTAARAQRRGDSPVRINPTSGQDPRARTPGPHLRRLRGRTRGSEDEYLHIRTWLSAVELLEHQRYRGRAGLGVRFLLRALAEAAQKAGSRYIDFGTRTLEIPTGMDHTVVAKHLRALRDEADPLIVLLEGRRGLDADLYELTIPGEVAKSAGTRPWRAGKIRALRPAFRALGKPAAAVFESLELNRGPGGLTSIDLADRTRLSRSTVYEALETLAAHNLAKPIQGRWSIVATTSLAELSEALGCADEIRQRVQTHHFERIGYRRALTRKIRWLVPAQVDDDEYTPQATPPPDHDDREHHRTTNLRHSHDLDYVWPDEPPVSDQETALELLERILGAARISA